jgi:DNA polymerase iota
VTCNYPARAAGIKKLMLVQDAYKVCPDLILLDASDLKDQNSLL